MAKRQIAVMAGGFSAEENISLQSGEVVFDALKDGKYTPHMVLVRKEGWFCGDSMIDKTDFSYTHKGNTIKFDAAFIAIHGSPGEDGLLQSYLEMLDIPHTTGNTLSNAITFNKVVCKELIADHDLKHLKLASGLLIKKGDDRLNAIEKAKKLNLPVFVKPNQNGSSYGISRIKEWEELEPALVEGFRYDSELLVEEGVEGTEVTCGLYEYQGETIALPLTEIVSEHEFFNYTAKYTSGEAEEITPARISAELTEQCQELTRKIYHAMGLNGLVRVDYILNEQGFYFLEVNTVPGLSTNSIVPRMVRSTGMTLTDFFERLIDEALVVEVPEN